MAPDCNTHTIDKKTKSTTNKKKNKKSWDETKFAQKTLLKLRWFSAFPIIIQFFANFSFLFNFIFLDSHCKRLFL